MNSTDLNLSSDNALSRLAKFVAECLERLKLDRKANRKSWPSCKLLAHEGIFSIDTRRPFCHVVHQWYRLPPLGDTPTSPLGRFPASLDDTLPNIGSSTFPATIQISRQSDSEAVALHQHCVHCRYSGWWFASTTTAPTNTAARLTLDVAHPRLSR